MIPRETVERILDSAKIEEVVGDFVTLKRRGANYIACCPFHNEKTPSFSVSPSKGIFKCFGCGKGGNVVNFVMEHENLTWAEAMKYLARKYHIEVVEKEETAEDIAARNRNESLLLVSEFARGFFSDQLKTPEGQIGYAYFKSRGLEDETIEKFGLGWAPKGRTTLLSAARQAGFKDEYLVDTGLCFRTDDGKVLDRFYDRVAFPIHNASGRVIAFGCRTLLNDKTVAKYVNSPETDIYSKRHTLYGLYQAKNEVHRQDKFILVEGYLDVISMHQLGICNVAASSGTSLTEEQVRLIKRFTDNVTIIYDGDSAGIHAALRGIGLVLEGGLNVKVVLLPDGDDPDSFSRKHTRDEVLEFIRANEQDFIGFKTRLLLDEAGRDPIKRAGLINDIADTIALIPDPVKRSVYVPFAARELEIDEQLLFDRIKKTRSRMLEERAKERERQQRRDEDRPFEDTAADFPPDDAYLGVPVAEGNPLVNDKELAPCEEELLRFVLCDGRSPLLFDTDSPFYREGESFTVAQFIDSVLCEDAASFSNVAYRKAYERYMELYSQGLAQEQIATRLLSDEDELVKAAAESVLVDRYQITVSRFEASLTNECTHLAIFVPKALIAYNKARVEKEIASLQRQLRCCGESDDLVMRIMELNKLKVILTQKLGRV